MPEHQAWRRLAPRCSCCRSRWARKSLRTKLRISPSPCSRCLSRSGVSRRPCVISANLSRRRSSRPSTTRSPCPTSGPRSIDCSRSSIRYVLARVHINPESRVRVEAGRAKPELVEGGTRLFLVKVINEAHVTAPLAVQSANTGPVYIRSSGSPRARMELTEAHVRDRWADISIYDKPPMRPRLSGLGIEYAILEVFSRDAGQRSRRSASTSGRALRTSGSGTTSEVLFTSHAGASRPAPRERRARSSDDGRIPDPRFAAIGSTRTSRSGWSRISSFSRRSIGADGAIDRAARPDPTPAVVTRGLNTDSQTMQRRRSPACRSWRSSWNAGSIRHATATTPAITTSTPRDVLTTRIRPKE